MAAIYRFHHYRLLPDKRQLLAGEQAVKLGGRALDMLQVLVERRDRVVDKHELMDLVWPRLVVEENNLQVQVMTLRKLLGHGAIATVPGRGYRFTLPVELEGADSTVSPTPGATVQPDAAPARAVNLPRQQSALIGRDDDLRTLHDLIHRHALVTVAGAGGIGKTRLAQAAAHAHAHSQAVLQADGHVCWVELAGVNDPALVPAAVARALGLTPPAALDLTGFVVQALRVQAAMLVLDNAEHLLDGVAAFVATLREAAPKVRLLVTSQEVLRVVDEQVFRPGTLRLPIDDDLSSAESSGAVALFVARVRNADRHFKLHDGNRTAIVDICRRLDGIPLAIELAAARVPLLGLEGVRSRLDERFRLLTAGERAVMRRHQTLRAALEWSHGLLSASQRVVFRRLGVFAGGFTLEAAQALVEDEAIDAWDVLEHLGALVDKSLVVAGGDPVPRYGLLETTRLFALERLAEADETEPWLRRHAEVCCALAEEQGGVISAGDQTAANLARLDLERSNLLHALTWAQRSPDPGAPATGLRMVAALRHFWPAQGLASLGLQQTLSALNAAQRLPFDGTRSTALASATQLQIWMGLHADALSLALTHLDLARAHGDELAARTAHLKAGMAACLIGRVDEANGHFDAGLAMAIEHDDLNARCAALTGLAAVASARGDRSHVDRMQEVVALRRGAGTTYNLGVALVYLANAHLEAGEAHHNGPVLTELAALLPGVGTRYLGQQFIDVMAAESARRGDWPATARLVSASAALRQASAMPLHAPWRSRQTREADAAKAALGHQEYESACAAGRALDFAAALELAIRLALEPAAAGAEAPDQASAAG